MSSRRPRRPGGFTVVEVVIACALVVLLIGLAVWIFVFGGGSSQRLTARLSLQQASRKALVRLLTEVQEGMEVLSPRPGSTLTYAVIRDKVSIVRMFAQHPSRDGTFELWRYVADPGLPADKRGELFLKNVKRLRFTCQSEGALQINLTLVEQGQEYSTLTTIRLRNLASSEVVW